MTALYRETARSIAAIALVLFSSQAAALCDGHACPTVDWSSPTHVFVRITQPDSSDHSEFTFRFATPLNIEVEAKSEYGGKRIGGTVRLLLSTVMLTRDLPIEKGFELEAWDIPAACYQLVAAVLANSVSGSPGGLKG